MRIQRICEATAIAPLTLSLLAFSSHLIARPTALLQHAVSSSQADLRDILLGPDGAFWFGEHTGNKIGRITTAGVITEYPVPTPLAGVGGVTNGPDGAIWFTESTANKIGRITMTGMFTEYLIPTRFSYASGITTGPDRALWFTEPATVGLPNKIGRVTTDGAFSEYPLTNPRAFLNDITTGPDGALWFTEAIGYIGRITTGGVVREFPTPSTGALSITTGPDGALWFTESGSNHIGRITTAGAVSEYPTSATSEPVGIVSGKGDYLWFTEFQGNNIARITTTGSITEYPLPDAVSRPAGITLGPDGEPWFTEDEFSLIGQFVSPTATLSLNPAVGIAGTNVTLTGSGFGANEVVKLYANSTGTDLFARVTADGSGAFSVANAVGPIPKGYNAVVGVGERSDRLGVASFTAAASLIVGPRTGMPGSNATVYGYGYSAYAPYGVFWPNSGFVGGGTTDGRGSFVQQIKIPGKATPGAYQIVGRQLLGLDEFNLQTVFEVK